MGVRSVFVLLAFINSVISFSGEFVPKSYYVIDHNGHKSDVVYFRSKRDVELFPLLRMKRGGGSSSSSQSSAKSSSSSNSNSGSEGGGGGGGAPYYPGGNDYNPGVVDPEFGAGFDPHFFHQFGGGGGNGGGSGSYSHSFASSSSSSSSGLPGQGGFGGVDGHGYNGPILFSRFGEDTGTGVKVSAGAKGQKGSYSASSSSIDSDGKIKYSVQSGKY